LANFLTDDGRLLGGRARVIGKTDTRRAPLTGCVATVACLCCMTGRYSRLAADPMTSQVIDLPRFVAECRSASADVSFAARCRDPTMPSFLTLRRLLLIDAAVAP
jgi:hypothetical protein